MSIHRIPDRYLTTTLSIFRESVVADSVGDLATSQDLAYASIKANVQVVSTQGRSETEFEVQGRVHIQTHVAYINRIEESVARDIHIGDIAYDQETGIKYLVLSIEVWQAPNSAIEDSHHIRLILKAISGIPREQLKTKGITGKGRVK